MTEHTQVSKEKIIYHTGIMLLSVWFGASGLLEILKHHLVWNSTLKMGYPPNFITALGFAKITGIIVLLIPNKLHWLKEWVFAAFFFDVIFAFISGYGLAGVANMAKPVIAFILILITYIMFRKINPVLRVSFK